MWRWLSRQVRHAPAPAAPSGLANFRIERRIGQGAGAQVYLARDLRHGRWVALKMLELGNSPASPEWHDALERFRREATVLHELQHPGIVEVLDAGATEQGAWMALEAVGGSDLSRYTRPARLLPPPLVARVGARIADALGYAHRRGVIHRDIKPANVLIDWAADIVKIGDFGLARTGEHTQTRSGVALGSPDYMAPEQLAGAAVGPAADFYSLGATLFELLAGRRPHEADNLGALLRAVAGEPAPDLAQLKPELDVELCATVNALLIKDAAARLSDGSQVAARLRACAGDAGPPILRTTP
jgi:eukaryotic-like serine/threonine-protein kinase